MKHLLRLALAPVLLATIVTHASLAADSGHVEFDKLIAPEKGELVDITLGRGVLKLASIVTKFKNAEAAQLISGLSRVRVNVVGLDETNREKTSERISTLRKELVRDGWDQIVAVRGKRQEDVAIFLKQRDGEIIDGVVVTVIDERKKEAVLVNIVGHIRAEQLAILGEHLEISQLRGGTKVTRN